MLISSPILKYVDKDLPSEKYRFLSKVYPRDVYCVLCTDCISPSKFSNCNVHNPLRNWLTWVNENIIVHLGDTTMSEKRLGTLLRIATGMLDKVSKIDAIDRIEIHYNLTHNVWAEYRNIQLEGLPF